MSQPTDTPSSHPKQPGLPPAQPDEMSPAQQVPSGPRRFKRLVDEHIARRFNQGQEATNRPGEASPSLLPIPPQVEKESPIRRYWPRVKPYLWRGRVAPAFWTVAGIFSIVVNLILVVILILVGRQLFFLKDVVSNQLIGGLYDNFVLMDQAHIVTTITVSDTIQVKDTIPVVFDLPLSQDTQVTLTEDTPVENATIYLNGQPVPLDLVLRKGTVLGIRLDIVVPVNQTVPVVLNVPIQLKVPVDIALDQTDLHKPFVGLKGVVSPYRDLLVGLPDSWQELPLCKSVLTRWLCRMLRFSK